MVMAVWRRTYRTVLRFFAPSYSFPLSSSAFPLRRPLPSSSLSRSSNALFYKPLSSNQPSRRQNEPADFDPDFYEPTSNSAGPDLPVFLQVLSQAKSQFATEDEALAFLRSSFTAKPTKDLLCSVLLKLRRDWESVVLVFRWAGYCMLESPWACHLMIWGLGELRRFDLAWMLLRRMHQKSLPTRQALVIMMERYASANEIEKAIKVFHALEKFNVKADVTTFYSLLRALCKHNNFQEAEELLLLKRSFFPLEAAGFNIILDGWCNILVNMNEAKRVWKEMAKYCILPDGTSYTYMIGCFAKHGNLFDSLKLYTEMKKRGWIPSLKVYNSIIYVLIRGGCLAEAHTIFDKIIEAGLQPDLETYNSMIIPLCETQKLDEAQEIIKMMSSVGVRPSMETYHAFVKNEDSERLIKLIEQMRNDGCHPNETTFLLIFNKVLSMGKPESALRIWSEMSKYDVIPDALHYLTMVKGLATNGRFPEAIRLYDEMKSKGFPADPELDQLLKGFVSKKKNHWSRDSKEDITGRLGRNQISRLLKAF